MRRKTPAQLDREIADALAIHRHVRRKWANAWFRPDWNAWTVGYYTEGSTGSAESYTTAGSEVEAKRIASVYNAEQEKFAQGRAAAVEKAKRARGRLK